MVDAIDILKKAGIDAVVLSDDSSVLDPYVYNTDFPALNVLMSGDVGGGVLSGTTVIAGESQTFKSMVSAMVVSSVLRNNEDMVCVFYDVEEGTSVDYWKKAGAPMDRIIVVNPESVEDLITDISKKLKEIAKNGLKVMFLLDSLGSLPSSQELAHANSDEFKTDVGARAKAITSMFRVLNAKLAKAKSPFIIINHVHEKIGSYIGGKQISGGHSIIYAANNVIMITSSRWKEGGQDVGRSFTLKVEKSRKTIKGKSVVIDIPYKGKISKTMGLFKTLLEVGVIEQAPGGWYKYGEKKFQRKTITDDELMQILEENKDKVNDYFKFAGEFDAS